MNGKTIASKLKFNESYAKFIKSENRLETWEESVNDVMQMHYNKFSGLLNWAEIEPHFNIAKQAYLDQRILASQRNLQFREKSITKHNTKLYNCFKRDTKFVTSTGMKSFEDFEHGDTLMVLTHLGNWKPAVVKNYGKAKLNKIKINRNKLNVEVYATSNHRWILNDGSITETLQEGDKLLRTPQTFKDFDYDSATPFEKLYWCYGMVFGDGTKVKDKGEYKYSMLRLCGKDKNFQDRFEEMGFKTSSSLSLEGDIMVYTGKYQKTAPNPEIDSPELIRAFVAGYLQADGEKNSNVSPSSYLTIQSSEQSHIDFIRNCFPIAGVHINSETDLTGQQTNFGIRPYTINFSLTQGQGVVAPYFKINEIQKDVLEEEVWCLEVEDDKSFILEHGIPTGNCSVTYVDRPEVFKEIMWVLLNGAGVGFSVESRFIKKLPQIRKRDNNSHFVHVIEDSIEGWAIAIDVLMNSFFMGTQKVLFDFSNIRDKGSLIAGEFIAPGPDGLKKSLELIEKLLENKIINNDFNLNSLDCHDIICILSDAVLSGGVRRSALISLFDKDDEAMLKCKTGMWWSDTPWRARANNSAKILKSSITKEELDAYKEFIKQFGEPGVVLVDDIDMMVNPCVEIGFKPINPFTGKSCWSFCNLNEIIGSHCKTEEDFYSACKAAAILGTFQASYTEFGFLGKDTEEMVRWEALLGVSITGIMNNPNILLNPEVLTKGAEIVKEVNKEVAKLIGINPAARTTCVKPSGNASVLAKTASGIHPAHAHKYFRTIQLNKDTPMAKFLNEYYPELLEEGVWSPTNSDYACFIPMEETPETVVKAQIDEIEFLKAVQLVYKYWVLPGTNKELGYSETITHNVSNTVSVTDWDKAFDYIFDNKEYFCGLSFLPNSGDKIYKQAPFTEVFTQEQLITKYGDAALFASGLIVDALHCFNNDLWDVCSAVTDKSFALTGDRVTVMVKKDIVSRIKKFAKNYFKGDLFKAADCLKDIHLYHKWVKINRVLRYKPIDFSKIDYTEKYLNADELSGASCSGGACELNF